ncbi:hypothetical protein JTB14_003233 [Gonioctena quinquepunctata]|nr:hypothetical protein JTB14_003233 [Gonioctena quinquepunctata]
MVAKKKTTSHQVTTTTTSPQKRRQQVIRSRLRMGHTRYTHDHIFKREPVNTCDLCLVPVSVKHILVECPRYNETSRKYSLEPQIKSLLRDHCDISNLLNFLNDLHLNDTI